MSTENITILLEPKIQGPALLLLLTVIAVLLLPIAIRALRKSTTKNNSKPYCTCCGQVLKDDPIGMVGLDYVHTEICNLRSLTVYKCKYCKTSVLVTNLK